MNKAPNKKQKKANNLKTNIKVLQWNCRSILNKLDHLKSIADEYDIIMLSETHLIEENTLNIKNFLSQ